MAAKKIFRTYEMTQKFKANPDKTSSIEFKKIEIWIYLCFPQLALDALTVQLVKQKCNTPIAIICRKRQIKRIYCCNAEAEKYGIDNKMSLSTALALCPDLQIKNRELGKEGYHLERLALIAYQFTPTVVFYNQLGLAIEISRCKRLYGSYDNLLQQLYSQISKYSSKLINGIGHTPLSAYLNCRFDFQKHVPDADYLIAQSRVIKLDSLKLSPRNHKHLKQLGLNTVDDVLKLPRSTISNRFEHELTLQLDLLTGVKPDSYTLFTVPNKFSDCMHNPDGIYSKEALHVPMKTLLLRLCEYLQAQNNLCQEIHWYFFPLLGDSTSMHVKFSKAHRNSSNLFSVSRLQLEQLELPHSITKILLESDQFISALDGSLDFFDDKNVSRKNGLIDQLTARLGNTALSQPSIHAEYLPEKANLINEKQFLAAQGDKKDIPKPLWLLTSPLPIKNNGDNLFWHRPLSILSGPERLCDNWWRSDQQRDYYLACNERGSRYWLYRDTQSKRWFIHGIFG